MTYIKVNETLYPASIDGWISDREWDNRATKTIALTMTYAEVLALLQDNTPWSIVDSDDISDADKTSEWDNSEFSMSGPITDNRDGTVTIKMGKPTDLEEAYAMLIGG